MREPGHRAGEPSRAREYAKGRSGSRDQDQGHGEAGGQMRKSSDEVCGEGSRSTGASVPLESVVCHPSSQHGCFT